MNRRSPAETEFRRFYRAHVGFVVRTVELLGVSGPHADDVAQEVVIVAHRKLDPLEGPGTRKWLFSTTRHLALRAQRTESRFARRRAAVSEAHRSRGPDRTAEAWDARQIVVRLLAQLGEPQRTAFVGVELLGMTAAELGTAVDVSPNTIASRLRSARARLATAAREQGRVLPKLVAQTRGDQEPPARIRSALWLGVSARIAPLTTGTTATTAGATVLAAAKLTAAAALMLIVPVAAYQERPDPVAVSSTRPDASDATARPMMGSATANGHGDSDSILAEASEYRDGGLPALREDATPRPPRGAAPAVPAEAKAPQRGLRSAEPKRPAAKTSDAQPEQPEQPEQPPTAKPEQSALGASSPGSGLGSTTAETPRLPHRSSTNSTRSLRPVIGDWGATALPPPNESLLRRPTTDGVVAPSIGRRSTAVARPMLLPAVQLPLASVAKAAQVLGRRVGTGRSP